MNKKGFIRTLEAVFAVLIVLGIILTLAPSKKQPEAKTPENIKQAQSFILGQIVADETLRKCITQTTLEGECKTVCSAPSIDDFVRKNTPSQYIYRCEICNSASTCSGALPLDKSLYTDSRLIASDPARVIRVIFWEK